MKIKSRERRSKIIRELRKKKERKKETQIHGWLKKAERNQSWGEQNKMEKENRMELGRKDTVKWMEAWRKRVTERRRRLNWNGGAESWDFEWVWINIEWELAFLCISEIQSLFIYFIRNEKWKREERGRGRKCGQKKKVSWAMKGWWEDFDAHDFLLGL